MAGVDLVMIMMSIDMEMEVMTLLVKWPLKWPMTIVVRGYSPSIIGHHSHLRLFKCPTWSLPLARSLSEGGEGVQP